MTSNTEIKPKKPIWKRWWFWIITIFGIFIIRGIFLDVLFFLLAFLTFIGLIVGLIKPNLVIRWGENKNRKRVALIFGIATLVFFILFAVNIPPSEKTPQTQVSLDQNVQDILTPEEGIGDDNGNNVEQSIQTAGSTEKQELLFKVITVIDGDTIKLENGEVVRYIGIDTPETVHPSKPVQCFGKEASDKNKELVEGKMVRLEKDITDKDKYGRLLRYVWVGNLFVNDYLIRQGYAYVYTYPPDVKYSEQFVQAQKEAQQNNRGLWAGCPNQEMIEEVSTPSAITTPPKERTICSYDAYNCSNFSTRAEAQSVFEYCGGVNNDIHRLDADKDGLACESLP